MDKIKELEEEIKDLNDKLEYQDNKIRSKLDYLLNKIHALEEAVSNEQGDEFEYEEDK